MCWGLALAGAATGGVGVWGGGEAWTGTFDMETSLDTAGEGGLVGAVLGLGMAGAGGGVGVGTGGGGAASTLRRILWRRSCCWRDF